MSIFIFLLLSCDAQEKNITDSTEPFVPIEWARGLPPLDTESSSLRAIVHLHSHHSHDACDGNPQPDGVPDEVCLDDLRMALCEVRIDVAFLSDHPSHSTEALEFESLFLIREGDSPIYENERLVANQLRCESGHSVLIFPGVESDAMMPLGLLSHIDGDYDGSPASIEAVHEQDAIMWVAHTESTTLDELVSLNLDGLELYQLHANLDPDIRAEYLGLDPVGFLNAVQPFFFPTDEDSEPPHPDLAPLAFVVPNEPSIDKMEALGQLQRIGISAGTDAHQNVFPIDASDGERIDSYRRMMRWFNTRIEVRKDATPSEIKSALKNGRTWIAFEAFGTPQGFSAELHSDGQVFGQGSEMLLAEDSKLVVELPTLHRDSPQGERAPMLEGRILFADSTGRETIHTWHSGQAEVLIEREGVYRIEVWIQPWHLLPYLGQEEMLAEQWVPWIYSGGFFLR